ncbi:MAG: DUF3606 domain-containing protein [Luteibacter sp.]|jgi:hypothetical protein
MTSNRPPAAPADVAAVDVTLPGDMGYWTRVLGVSEQALRDAVERVGTRAADVRAELRRRR